MTPFFTIIIPVYQSEATLAATLDSLAAQSERDFEVVLSDGASRDRTVEIARSYESRLPRLVVSSRPDEGVYDAVNAGIRIASGEWLLVLGSDDVLAGPDVLGRAKNHLEASNELLVYGDVLLRGAICWAHDGAIYDGEFDRAKLLRQNICQQAIFYRRRVFSLVGDFNRRYKACADWDFALRVASRYPIRYVPLTVAIFSASGLSAEGDHRFLSDRALLLLKYFGPRTMSREFAFLWREFLSLASRLRREGRFLTALAALAVSTSLGARKALDRLLGPGGSVPADPRGRA